MSPAEIQLVRESWAVARANGEALIAEVDGALARRGGHDEAERLRRRAWMVTAIDALMPFLDRPTSFVEGSRDLIRDRMPVTLTELGADRDDLLTGVQRVTGGLDEATQRAWTSATDLFGEIIGDLILKPFGGVER
jgi:hypothetical protein